MKRLINYDRTVTITAQVGLFREVQHPVQDVCMNCSLQLCKEGVLADDPTRGDVIWLNGGEELRVFRHFPDKRAPPLFQLAADDLPDDVMCFEMRKPTPRSP